MSLTPSRSAELTAALAAFDVAAAGFTVISPPAPAKRDRALYRAALGDGSTVKLRVLESAEAAQALCTIRTGLPGAFAPALGCHGSVVVEEWIDGPPLTATAERCAEAGTVLASLHRHPVAGGREPSAPWLATARADLAHLQETGYVGDDAAAAIERLLATEDPGSFAPAVIHRDFCGVNMVVDAAGALRVVDNEWLMHGPAGFDVGRALNRWGLPESERAAFLAAYERGAGPPEAEGFWGLAADLFGARVETFWNPGPGTPILDGLLVRVSAVEA